MHTRRSAIKVSAVLCWVAALSTVIWEIPGDKTENLIYAIAVTATLVWRVEPGPSMTDNVRHIGRILYMRGLHDGMRRGGSRGAGTRAQAPKPRRAGKELRTRPRLWHWLALPAVAGVALGVVIAASPASPLVAPMPGVYVFQPEGASEPMRTRPARTENAAPAKSTQQRERRTVGPTSTGHEAVSPPSQEPSPLVETPAPGVLETPGKATRTKAPKVPRPRPVLSSLLSR